MLYFLFIFLEDFIYLFMKDTERGRDIDRGRSRLPAEQGAWYGAQTQDPGIITWAEGRCLTNWAT